MERPLVGASGAEAVIGHVDSPIRMPVAAPQRSGHLVHGKNVGMVQRRRRPRFLLEATKAIGIGRDRLRQDLDGDFAVEPGIVRATDFAHSTRGERRAPPDRLQKYLQP